MLAADLIEEVGKGVALGYGKAWCAGDLVLARVRKRGISSKVRGGQGLQRSR